MPNWIERSAAILFIAVTNSLSASAAAAECDCGSVCACPECPVQRQERRGGWFILETANFQVCCDRSETQAMHLARHAEAWRKLLCSSWRGEPESKPWIPKCQIVLHSSQRSYLSAVGRGGERTVGSSLVKADKGRILSRRIDLLGVGTSFLSAALPHELTHVVLRDSFTATVVPRWADEGMAVLADTVAKQERHEHDLKQAVAQRAIFRSVELLAIDDYPPVGRFGTFYGQSASLTRFLVARKSPEQFVKFLNRAREAGYDAALLECYDLNGVGELDRQWRQYMDSLRPTSFSAHVSSRTHSGHLSTGAVATLSGE
jgi:hypothetical protein